MSEITGNKNIVITPNTPFLNSQSIFIEYEDIIKCPAFVLINALKENKVADKIFDFSEIKSMNMDELFEWYQNRRHKNVFKNIPLTEFGKEKFKVPTGMTYDSFMDSFLYSEYENIPGIVDSNSILNFAKILPKLFDASLVHKIYIWSEIYSERIEKDLENLYGRRLTYVTGDLKSVLIRENVPNDSTYVFSNIRNILILKDANKLEKSSVIIADEFGYNMEGDSSCINLEELASQVLFKLDFFDNTHIYR